MLGMENIITAVGALTILSLTIRVLHSLRQNYPSTAILRTFRGDWAVVTGASSGIGAAFARNLASHGINIIFLARSHDKMQAVAAECRNNYAVDTVIHSVDFSTANDADYEQVAELIRPLSPKILVNNVGINTKYVVDFVNMPAEEMERICKVNMQPVMRMTYILLPGMLAARKGIVYCMSSFAGPVCPVPLLSVYGATKAFVDSFALCLSGEVSNMGVIVHSLTPWFIEGSMAKVKESLVIPSQDNFVKKALQRTGGCVRYSPYWVHRMLEILAGAIPLSWRIFFTKVINRRTQRLVTRNMERRAKRKAN